MSNRFLSSFLNLGIVVGLGIGGCSTPRKEAQVAPPLAGTQSAPSRWSSPVNVAGTRAVAGAHYELFVPGKAFDGSPIQIPGIAEGDLLYREGRFEDARKRYLAIRTDRLPAETRSEILVRLVAVALRQERAEAALTTLSRFFTRREQSEGAVDGRFSLLFAAAYGQKGDLDQAFAWASQAVQREPRLTDRSSDLVLSLVKQRSDDELATLSSAWESDSFIRRLLGEERGARQRGAQGLVAVTSPATLSGTPVEEVSVLLPLTGRFSKVGERTRDGFALALDRPIVVLDTGSEPGLPPAAKLALESSSGLIVGPLLADHALEVRDLASQQQRAALLFSRSESLLPTPPVYQFAPTAESQVRSLLMALRAQAINSLVIVAPTDGSFDEIVGIVRETSGDYGVSIVADIRYPRGDRGALLAVAQEVESIPAAGVFIPESAAMGAHLFSSLTAEARATRRPVGGPTWEDPQALAQGKTVLNGALYVTPFFARSPRAEVVTFVQKFRERFGADPDVAAAQGYDAGLIARELLSAARIGRPFEAEMARLAAEFQGVTGRIVVDIAGRLQRRFPVVELRDGALREVPVVLLSGGSHETTTNEG